MNIIIDRINFKIKMNLEKNYWYRNRIVQIISLFSLLL